MLEEFKQLKSIKRLRKTKVYSRFRQYFPQVEYYLDDGRIFDDVEKVFLTWPEGIKKPRVGIVRDFGHYPRWTKYCRFLETNAFDYQIYDLHSHGWIERANQYDVIAGVSSGRPSRLQETREKYHFLETYFNKSCYPSSTHVMLYENKKLEAYITSTCGLPFAETVISYHKEDALRLADALKYPVVSKINPSSGSAGVDLVKNATEARKIIQQAFSSVGRKTHVHYSHQKDYVYFQQFIPSDGYDIRVIVVGNYVFGYYRKVMEGDYRASGMNIIERRELPYEAIQIAFSVNQVIQSPMLAVDMMHGLDDKYYIIEFSPLCQLDDPEHLHVDGVPGVYVFNPDGSYHFERGKYWVAELALREFLLKDYLPKVQMGTGE